MRNSNTSLETAKYDSATFDELFVEQLELALPKLRRIAFKIAGCNTLADDLVQTACLKAWKARTSYDPNKPIVSWMSRIMKNAFIDDFRSAQRRADIILSVDIEDLRSNATNPTDVQNEMMDILNALNELTDIERNIILLKTVVGLSHEQVSANVGITTANARQIFSRSVKKLAKQSGMEKKIGRPNMGCETAFETLRKEALAMKIA